MRKTLLTGALLGILAAAPLAPPPACAQEAPAPEPEPEPEPQPAGVLWIDGWEAGRAAARERGRLMLVYVHRTSPH